MGALIEIQRQTIGAVVRFDASKPWEAVAHSGIATADSALQLQGAGRRAEARHLWVRARKLYVSALGHPDSISYPVKTFTASNLNWARYHLGQQGAPPLWPTLVALVMLLVVTAVFWLRATNSTIPARDDDWRDSVTARLEEIRLLHAGQTPASVDNQLLQQQLGTVVNARGSQDVVLWTAFGVFWAANALMLVALLNDGEFTTNASVRETVRAVGILTSLLWAVVQFRAIGNIRKFETTAKNIESALPLIDAHRMYAKATPGIARWLMLASSAAVLLVWCFFRA